MVADYSAAASSAKLGLEPKINTAAARCRDTLAPTWTYYRVAAAAAAAATGYTFSPSYNGNSPQMQRQLTDASRIAGKLQIPIKLSSGEAAAAAC